MKRKTLVILATAPNEVDPLAKFLRAEGWDVLISCDLFEIKTLLLIKKPNFFMLSEAYKNLNSKAELEKQGESDGFSVIMFDEHVTDFLGKNPKGNTKYNLTQPISGPDFLSLVEQISRDSSSTQLNNPTAIKKVLRPIAEKTISEVSSGGKLAQKEFLTTGANALCLYIDSSRFSGCFVTALGNNRPMSAPMVSKIQTKLSEFIKSSNETLNTIEKVDVTLGSTHLEDWAVNNCSFTQTGIHNGSELSISFMPALPKDLSFEEGPTKDMFQISVDDISPDQVIDFELYHFLQLNNKYVRLFTTLDSKSLDSSSEDKSIIEARFKKIKSSTSHLFFKKGELPSAQVYKVKNRLAQSIQQMIV